jgi:ribose/xylose/arabinose/galactoside ABC-type transport system permease subunit
MHDRDVVYEGAMTATSEDRKNRSFIGWLRKLLGKQLRNAGLALALVIALVIVSVQRPTYFSYDNFLVVGLQMSFIGIAALGTTALIIGGNIDLSIGSMFALSAVAATLLARHIDPAFAILGGIALGGLVGWINGLLVWRVKLSPIIITLGTLTLLRGVVLLLTDGFAITGVPSDFGGFGQARPLGIPMPVLILIILAPFAYLLLQRTTMGRHVFAIGGNREAAEAAGLSVRRLVLASFAVNGVAVGLAGVLAASRFASADPSFGTGFELDVITAVILGGVAFTGGEGGIGGVILAVALLGVINSGLVSLGVNPFYTNVVKGAVLIIAVALDQLAHEQRERYQKYLAMRERRRA